MRAYATSSRRPPSTQPANKASSCEWPENTICASTRASASQPSMCWRFCSAMTASVRCVSRRISSLSER